MILANIIRNKISKVTVATVSLVTAAIIAFGGLSPVGAQATGTYTCGTYGASDYNQTDCSDPAPSTGTTTSPSTGTTAPSTGSTPKSTGSTPSKSTGSSASSSPATSTPAKTTAATILLNDFSEYTATTGKSLTFKVGDVFYFNLNGTKHTITVKSFDASNMVVTIASTPTDVTVPVGQTVNHDADQDGAADIAITYSAIAADNASATAVFRALNKTAAATAPTASTSGSQAEASAGGTTENTGSNSMWWIWIFPIIIGIGLLIWAIIAARRRKAAANNVGGSNLGQF